MRPATRDQLHPGQPAGAAGRTRSEVPRLRRPHLVDQAAERRVTGCLLYRGRRVLPELHGLRAEHLADPVCRLVGEALRDGGGLAELDVDRRLDLVVEHLRRFDWWGGDRPHGRGVSWADLGELLLRSFPDDEPDLATCAEHLLHLADLRAAIDEVAASLGTHDPDTIRAALVAHDRLWAELRAPRLDPAGVLDAIADAIHLAAEVTPLGDRVGAALVQLADALAEESSP